MLMLLSVDCDMYALVLVFSVLPNLNWRVWWLNPTQVMSNPEPDKSLQGFSSMALLKQEFECFNHLVIYFELQLCLFYLKFDLLDGTLPKPKHEYYISAQS